MHDVYEITSAIASASSDTNAHVEAFGRLYDAKFDEVYRKLRRRTGVDEATALDLVQDTMMRVIRHIKPMRTEDELDAWLSRVAMTTAYDYLRMERRRRLRELRVAADASSDVRGAVELNDLVESMRNEIASLDHGAFDLLNVRFRTGMKLNAIGRRFGIGPGAADGRLRRTMQTLRAQLEERHDAPE